jgi:hypothetical protein
MAIFDQLAMSVPEAPVTGETSLVAVTYHSPAMLELTPRVKLLPVHLGQPMNLPSAHLACTRRYGHDNYQMDTNVFAIFSFYL